MQNKIIFISGYDNTDKFVNGYIQLFNLFQNNNYEVALLKVDKIWKKEDFSNTKRGNIRIFFPLLKLKSFLFLKKYFTYLPKQENVHTLVFDSDPYTILIHEEIIDFYKPKIIIYRQSDPMILIDKNGLVGKCELKLMKTSNQVWVANEVIKKKMLEYGLDNIYTLVNPIKLSSINTLVTHKKTTPYLVDKVLEAKKHYDNIGIYYGKFGIDFMLIDEISKRSDKTAFFIIGEYSIPKNLNSNVFFIPYQSLEDIVTAAKLCSFFFIPYRVRGNLNDILHVTAKILIAKLLNKPVLAHGVSQSLNELNIFVGDSASYFIDKISKINELSAPNIDLDYYSEDNFLNTALTYIDKIKDKDLYV